MESESYCISERTFLGCGEFLEFGMYRTTHAPNKEVPDGDIFADILNRDYHYKVVRYWPYEKKDNLRIFDGEYIDYNARHTNKELAESMARANHYRHIEAVGDPIERWTVKETHRDILKSDVPGFVKPCGCDGVFTMLSCKNMDKSENVPRWAEIYISDITFYMYNVGFDKNATAKDFIKTMKKMAGYCS
jgi:hypothetical protein